MANCPACTHPSDDHSNLAGCIICTCTTKRRDIPALAPGLPAPAPIPAPKTMTDAVRERDAAMAQVASGTDQVWAALAQEAVNDLAASGRIFSSDDVWDTLVERRVAVPREPRALGPIMKRSIASGVIVQDGYTKSRRRHAAILATYQGVEA